MKIDKISYFVNICFPPQRHEIIQNLILGDENDDENQEEIENDQSNLEISNSNIQLPSIKSSSSSSNQETKQRKLGLKERMRKSEQFIKEEKARSTISNFIFENRQK